MQVGSTRFSEGQTESEKLTHALGRLENLLWCQSHGNGQETTIVDILLIGYSNFVDNGIHLELVGEPFVDRHLTLALHLVTAVAVFLVHADHDAWHFWACRQSEGPPREERHRLNIRPCTCRFRCQQRPLPPPFRSWLQE